MSISVEIGQASIKNIRDMANKLSNVTAEKLFNDQDKDALGLRINTKLKTNIDGKLDVYGKAMTPLKPSTYNRKNPNRGGPDATPLKFRSFLYGGMEYKVEDGNIILFNNTPYVLYHQEGTGKIPQRQIYPEQNELPNYLQKIIDNFIQARITVNMKEIGL